MTDDKAVVYLGWPVKLKDPFHQVRAHITLKFLGEGPFSQEDIAHRLDGHKTSFAFTNMEWTPQIFDKGAHVMVLSGVDRALIDTRAAVEDLRKFDWAWRPHISFKKDLWYSIQANGWKVDDLVDSVGPLTLFFREPESLTQAVCTF